jgi:IMP dehydrogenase
MSQEIEIGLGKKGRLAYSLDDVAIVPSRRTRDPEDVSTAWQVDAYEFDVPVLGAPMDSVSSSASVIAMGRLGALGVLDLEGLWTRYEDPQPLLDEIAQLPADAAIARMQEIYTEPMKAELIAQRLHEIRDAGVTVAASLSPQCTQEVHRPRWSRRASISSSSEAPWFRPSTSRRAMSRSISRSSSTNSMCRSSSAARRTTRRPCT